MTNGYKTLIIILVISIILILSGCVNKSKDNIIRVPGNNTAQIQYNYTEQILDNNTIKIDDIINIIVPEKYSTYDDNEFVKIVEEANNIIDNNNMLIMVAAEKRNFEDIEKYGKNLELNTTKYMSILKSLTISPRFEKMYSEYYNYLENMNKTGQHIQESVKQHKLIDTGSCNNQSSYHEQM